MRAAVLLLCFAVTALVPAAAGTAAAPQAAFTKKGTVTYVVDGDTVDVRLVGGGTERVRLIGIDTPEQGRCYAADATAAARRVALGKQVVLKGDATQDTRDRYGRLLAYVLVGGGVDLGLRQLQGGFAEVYVFRSPFQRLGAYRQAEQAAKGGPRGRWKACTTAAGGDSGAGAGCHPSYSPCLPIVADLDCADVRALGKAPVRVLGSDPYRLDGDRDGWGCE